MQRMLTTAASRRTTRAAAARLLLLQRQRAFASAETKDEKAGLGAHFGGEHEHKESALLKMFVAAGNVVANVGSAFSNSSIADVVAPKSQQVHSFRNAAQKDLDVEVEELQDGTTVVVKKDQRVEGVAINTEQFAVIPVGEVQDHSEPESAWGLFSQLLRQKKFKTTQQQATDKLYELIPDFNESEFLEDIEHQLMPSFLEAFWAKDTEALQAMCTPACYHLNVETHLKQYEKLESRCRLLMTRRAALFNRLMFIDDSDHAPSVKRRAALAEKGIDLDDLDDLDIDEEKPEAIFFVSCSAHVESEWVDPKSGDVKIGGKHEPEDWYFVFGLTPQPGPTWTVSSLEFTKMQAMGAASTSAE